MSKEIPMNFEKLINELPGLMVCHHNSAGEIISHNNFFEYFFAGDSGDQLVGVNIHELLDAGIVDTPQLSYSSKYKTITLENPLQDRLTFKLTEYQEPQVGDSPTSTVKVFQDISYIKALESQIAENLGPSYSTLESGAFPKSFLQNELPVTYNAYSRTGHRMAMVLFEINSIDELKRSGSEKAAQYVFKETASHIKSTLRRKEDFVIEYNDKQILLCLFNMPIWHPNGVGHKKTVEEVIEEIQDDVLKVEIPQTSLRVPMEKVYLNAGVVESLEREALDSLLLRAEEALNNSLNQKPGHVEIAITNPFF